MQMMCHASHEVVRHAPVILGAHRWTDALGPFAGLSFGWNSSAPAQTEPPFTMLLGEHHVGFQVRERLGSVATTGAMLTPPCRSNWSW